MPVLSLPSRKRARRAQPEHRCAACRGLFSKRGLQELQSNDGYAHCTRREAEASVKDGCSLCQFFAQAVLSKFGRQKWSLDDRLVFRSQPRSERQAVLTVLEGRIAGASEAITIYPFTQRGDPLAALIPRRPVQRDVKSKAVFAAARKLIHTCLRPDKPSEGHELCRYSRDTVLPTRVLNVGDPRNSDSLVRLQVNEFDIHGSYLALSYCWGKPPSSGAPFQNLLLRKNSLHDMTSQISLQNLQQSIQDAIWVTRKLGFRYLWVDALCIIQDDDEDKGKEISKMATIYKNAAITLAAGTAERASEGFLGDPESKPTIYLPEDKFAIPMENGEIGTVYLSAEPYEPDHPLDKRGWTLQEFMLSSRMLIFSDYQLLWQCKEVGLQSVTGDDRGLEYQQHLEHLPWKVFDEEAEVGFGASDSDKLYIWKTIILQYTERNLTEPNDRLPAVSGITSELGKLWRDSNIWGLWRRWFIPLLAWYKVDIDRVNERNLKRAPSWSWASLDGRIHYRDPLEAEDAEIQTLAVARVVLSCRMLNLDDVDDDVEVDNDHGSVLEWPDLADPAWKEELGQRDLLYLLLGTTQSDSHGSKGLGLLMVSVANNRYRRIGLAVFPDMSIWEGVERQTIEFEPKQ
ncbi:hypothetical protein ACHAPT_010657 [Fusarium lateritium]